MAVIACDRMVCQMVSPMDRSEAWCRVAVAADQKEISERRREGKNGCQSLWISLCHPPPSPNLGQTISRGLAGAHVTSAVGMTEDRRRQCS
jgi:hypothetical protein